MSQKPKNLSDAIDDLEDREAKGGGEGLGGGDLRARIEREIRRMEGLLEDMKPHLNEFSEKVGPEAHKAKRRLEHQVTKNPLASVGVVALIAFVIGLLIGRRRD